MRMRCSFVSEGNEGRAYALPLTLDRLFCCCVFANIFHTFANLDVGGGRADPDKRSAHALKCISSIAAAAAATAAAVAALI